jgi:hypothetical protein
MFVDKLALEDKQLNFHLQTVNLSIINAVVLNAAMVVYSKLTKAIILAFFL